MGEAPRHSSMASSSTTSWPYFMPMAAHIERSSRWTISAYSRTKPHECLLGEVLVAEVGVERAGVVGPVVEVVAGCRRSSSQTSVWTHVQHVRLGAGPARPGRGDGRIGSTRSVEATVAELRDHGYDGLTVRNAARRAGVAAATAYTYFASKDHLVAEVFWRRLQTLEPRPSTGVAAPAPACPTPCASSRCSSPTSPSWRPRPPPRCSPPTPTCSGCATASARRSTTTWRAALGDDADPAVLRALNLALAGALLQAGMGYFSYAELADRMAEVAGLLVGGAGR